MLNVTATDDVGVTKLQYSTDAGANWLDIAITPGPSVTRHGVVHRRGQHRRALPRARRGRQHARAALPRNGTLNQAAAVGATAVRLASTNGRAVGDELVIDTGDNAGDGARSRRSATPAPAVAEPERHADGSPLTKAHAAGTAIQVVPAVPHDQRARSTPSRATATMPGHGRSTTASATDSRRSRPRAPIRRRAPAPPPCGTHGSTARGSTRCRWTPRSSRSASTPGRSGLTDMAGNGNKVTFTFLVTTSFADIDALLTRYGTGGTIPAADGHRAARDAGRGQGAADAGDPAAAISGWRRSSRRSARRRQRRRRATCSSPTRRTSSRQVARHPGRRRPRPTSASRPSATRASRGTRTSRRRCRPRTRARSSRSS